MADTASNIRTKQSRYVLNEFFFKGNKISLCSDV